MKPTTIPVLAIEFHEGGNTLWVQGLGGTVLRIKTSGKFTSKRCAISPVSHADINVIGDVEICLARTQGLEQRYLKKVDEVILDLAKEVAAEKGIQWIGPENTEKSSRKRPRTSGHSRSSMRTKGKTELV